MGSAYSHNQDSVLSPPDGYVTPPFPSLYNPRNEFQRNSRHPTEYLFYSKDIYKFTLYWTLILYLLTYGLCGLWAGLVRAFLSPPKDRRISSAILLTLAFFVVGTFSAVVGSAIIGYVLAAVYSVGSFTMSTWVPFLWALVQTFISIMGSYSTVTTLL